MTIKRNEKNIKILDESSLTTLELKQWIVDLFFGDGGLNFHLTADVFDWWVEVALNNYEKAETKKVKRLILNKVLHTREVVEAGLDIMARTEELDDHFKVCTVCLLHDIGRFEQALLGSYSDRETNFDHAERGALLVKSSNLREMEFYGVDKESVVEAVAMHSRIDYLGKDIYAKLTRDADKLALLRYMPYLISFSRFPHGKPNENAITSFRSGCLVKHQDMKTYSDVLLAWLSWEADFNFEATQKAFVEEGIRQWILDELKKEGFEI